MKKNTALLLGALVLGFAGFLGYQQAVQPTSPDSKAVRIGAILPMTGDFGYLGEEVNKGALLAVEEARVQGTPVDYISEDDAFDPARSASAAQKLTSTDHVDAAFTALGEEAMPITTVFNTARTPLLVAWDSNAQLKAAGDSIFSIGFSTERDGALMADYARRTLGLTTVAVVWTEDAFADVIVEAFTKEFEAQGGRVLLQQRISYDQTDHRTLIARLKSAAPDGLYTAIIPPQNVSFLTQLRQAGFPKPVLSADCLITSDIHTAGPAAEGVYLTTIYAEHADLIAQKYKNYFGTSTTETTLVSFGYDSVMTLLAAHKLALAQNISLRDALTQTRLQGLGAPIDFAGKQYSERVEKIYQVRNGQPVAVEQ